jgi:thiamine-phosphate pyrophosphorylase
MIVHLVTDRHRLVEAPHARNLAEASACLVRQTRYAIEAGVDCVQVRERDLDGADLARVVAELVACTRGTATRVLVNDRLDVAMAVGADGVHLRADSMPVAVVRRLAPPDFIVGRSVHSVAEAAAASGADYLVAGTVWATASKGGDHLLLGIDGFASIVRAVQVPVLAIGGVTAARASEVASAGGAGIAAIGLFVAGEPTGQSCRAGPLAAKVEAMRARFDTPGSRS